MLFALGLLIVKTGDLTWLIFLLIYGVDGVLTICHRILLHENLDLRNGAEDSSQRMLNAIEPGSPLSIHRHRSSSETVVCLRGRLVEEYYASTPSTGSGTGSAQATCTERIELSPGGPVVAVNIPAGQWHTAKALESGTVILEMKNGAYEPIGPEDILEIPARRPE